MGLTDIRWVMRCIVMIIGILGSVGTWGGETQLRVKEAWTYNHEYWVNVTLSVYGFNKPAADFRPVLVWRGGKRVPVKYCSVTEGAADWKGLIDIIPGGVHLRPSPYSRSVSIQCETPYQMDVFEHMQDGEYKWEVQMPSSWIVQASGMGDKFGQSYSCGLESSSECLATYRTATLSKHWYDSQITAIYEDSIRMSNNTNVDFLRVRNDYGGNPPVWYIKWSKTGELADLHQGAIMVYNKNTFRNVPESQWFRIDEQQGHSMVWALKSNLPVYGEVSGSIVLELRII